VIVETVLRSAAMVWGIAAIILVGFAMLVVSNQAYYRRTRDPDYGNKFWLRKSILNRQEYVLNRVGFVLAIGGAIGLLLRQVL
jgi:hypothetical protein